MGKFLVIAIVIVLLFHFFPSSYEMMKSAIMWLISFGKFGVGIIVTLIILGILS